MLSVALRAGALHGLLRRRKLPSRIPISKIEVFNPLSKSSYHIPFEQALQLTTSRQAKWHGGKRIILNPDRNLKVTWAPRQSGYAGPLTLQVMT
jgi:hypothetical protein